MQDIADNTEIIKYITRIVGQDDCMDMLTHLIMIIYDLPDSQLDDIIAGQYLKYYCFTIVRNQAINKDSSWNKGRNVLAADDDLPDMVAVIDDVTIYDAKQLNDIINALKHIHWEQATLFKLHYLMGLSIAEISRETSISRQVVTRKIEQAKAEIQSMLLEKYKPMDVYI